MPVPSAVIRVRISWEAIILSKRAFSTLSIFPLRGRIAWFFRSRPCLAEPPAESPSTRYSSHREGSFSWQSASLPGRPPRSSAPLRRTVSRALRAASRARAASMDFSRIRLATWGFSSRNWASRSFISDSTYPLTSELPSLVLVCPSNWGWGILTEMTDVIPSRRSSPEMDIFSFFSISLEAT